MPDRFPGVTNLVVCNTAGGRDFTTGSIEKQEKFRSFFDFFNCVLFVLFCSAPTKKVLTGVKWSYGPTEKGTDMMNAIATATMEQKKQMARAAYAQHQRCHKASCWAAIAGRYDEADKWRKMANNSYSFAMWLRSFAQ